MNRKSVCAAFFGIPIIVIIAVVLAHRSDSSASAGPVSYSPAHLETAALPTVLPVYVGKVSYTRTTVATSTIAGVEKRIDKCDGPVAVPLGSTVLVAEHDYCGGAQWMGRIEVGQAIKLSGPGVATGTYVADELRYQLRGKAKVSDLPAGDVVLQTCVSKTELVLVGMHMVQTISSN